MVASLAALSVVAIPQPAQAATIQQTQTFGPGSGGFRIPQNATNISVTIAGGEGWGLRGDGGKGGSMSFTLGSSFAGVPIEYTVGAAGVVEILSGDGDDAIGYRGGGGASAFAVPGGLLIVVGGGGGSGGAITGASFPGGDGGVVDPTFRNGAGDSGQGPPLTGAGGQGGEQGPSGTQFGLSRGGSGGNGMPFGASGQDSPMVAPPANYALALGGVPGVRGQFSACGEGGSGYAGGGGGGDQGRDGCGAGGGGSGVFRNTNGVNQTARGLNSGDGSMTISFDVPELVVTPPTLPTAQQGVAFLTAPVTVTGGATGAGGLTRYSFAIASGALPDGVLLDPLRGRIGGTPTVSGSFPFTLAVTDENSPAPQTVGVPLTLTVQGTPLSLAANAAAAGRVGQPLSWTPAAVTGGNAPYTWSIDAGSIPSGTSLDAATGVISGVPTAVGSYQVALEVQDSSGPPQTAQSSLATLVLAATPITAPASVRRGASAAVSASGLVAGDYSIQLDSAAAGTTTVAAPGALTATVAVPVGATLGSHTVIVLYQGIEVGRTTLNVLSAALAATPLVLPDAQEGDPYSAPAVTVTGGLGPLVYSSSDLPAGLSIDAATGQITGTPTVNGSFTIHVDVQDAESPAQVATASIPLEVAPVPPPPTLTLTTSSAQGHVGIPFAATPVTVVDGTAPYSFALDVGQTLPAGLTLDAATGQIAGTATASFAGSVAIVVTDSSAQTASGSFSLTVSQLTITATGSVPVGGTVLVSGTGFDAGVYEVVLHSDPVTLGSATVGSNGQLLFSAVVPGSVTPGAHQVQVLRSGALVASASITVTGAAVSASGGAGLAATGVDTTPGWIAGSALLLAGWVVVLASMIRRRSRPARES